LERRRRPEESVLAAIKHQAWYVTLKEGRKAIKRRLGLSQYRGNTYACPVCGTHLNSFKPVWKSWWRAIAEHNYIYPVSAIETFNAQAYSCPACDASDRERLFVLHLDRIWTSLDPSRRYRLVEFAPSVALRRRLRRLPSVDYRSADLYRRSVDDRIDITAMSYGDASIDMMLCSHVLEHVPDDRQAMREMFRVLKPGGFAIVMVPLIVGLDETLEDPAVNTRDLRWTHYGDGDHVRQYGKRDFFDRLRAAGFMVERLGISEFGTEPFRRAGIAENSELIVARKPGA
jgi:predicted SAM-dependent methyltransferase/ribosomal protein L37AE/L43A